MLIRGLVLGSLLLTACGGGAQPGAAPRAAAAAGDPARGTEVFTSATCSSCHTIQGVSEGQIGPELTHIAAAAADRLTDPGYKGKAKDAAGYIRESIVDPNAYVSPTCPTGPCLRDIMPKDFAQKLTRQQLDDLIAYLSTRR